MSVSQTVGKALVKTSSDAVSSRDEDWMLVQRVQAGDHAAFDQLILKYRERLYRIIYNLTGNREDASDLTQDSFIKAFRSISRFKGKSGIFTWLYRIGVNTALTFLNKQRRRRFFSFDTLQEDAINPILLEAITAGQKTEKPVILKELQEELNTALQKLSLKHRTVVTLYEIEGLDHDSIAEIMNCSAGTVRSRLHYAKQQLQSHLKHYLK